MIVSNPAQGARKAGNRKVSGSFFVSFAQSAVFGAFFMQRMCNLGERAKDTVPYRAVVLADSWSTGPKGRRAIVYKRTLLICIVRAIIWVTHHVVFDTKRN